MSEERYSVSWETVAGVEIAVLRDREREAELRVAPAFGNTCIGYRVGDWRVLDEPPKDDELLHRATSYGMPILFPWPNRLRHGRFTWEEREYQVPVSAGSLHANHGLVRQRPWQVRRVETSDSHALIECGIHSADFPELAAQYPSAFQLSVEYSLSGGVLDIGARVTNVGRGTLPFGFGLHPYGLHPYIKLPLDPADTRASCRVWTPPAEVWELEDYIPTGLRQPAMGRLNFEKGPYLEDQIYDDLFRLAVGPEEFPPGELWKVPLEIDDPSNRRRVIITADAAEGFRDFVVFAPANRSVVALEHYTCTTDTLNLQPRGIDAGLRILSPGAIWTGTVIVVPDRAVHE